MPDPRDPRPGPVTGVARLPRIEFRQREIDAIVADATKSVAKKMGVRENQLPTSVKNAIKTATTTALNIRAKAVIQRDVDAAVKAKLLSGVTPLGMLGDRMKAAKDGLHVISTDPSVEEVLKDTAVLLWKKFAALKTAGFSPSQAFDLLHAEVQGRASRNR